MPALAASWRRRRSAAWAPWWRRSGIPKDSCSPSSFRQSASPQDNQSDWSPRLRSSAKIARLHLDRVDVQVADVDVARAQSLGCRVRSEEHTSELQSIMRISYAVFCLKKKKRNNYQNKTTDQ